MGRLEAAAGGLGRRNGVDDVSMLAKAEIFVGEVDDGLGSRGESGAFRVEPKG